MRHISERITPAFICDVILEQQEDKYLIVKNTLEHSTIGTVIDEAACQEYLNTDLKVCVRMNDRYRIYNFKNEKMEKIKI